MLNLLLQYSCVATHVVADFTVIDTTPIFDASFVIADMKGWRRPYQATMTWLG